MQMSSEHRIYWKEVADEQTRDAMEEDLITALQPPWNQSRVVLPMPVLFPIPYRPDLGMTTGEVAALLNTDQQNIRKWCARHNVPRFGTVFTIDEPTFARIKARLGKPGREKKEETK